MEDIQNILKGSNVNIIDVREPFEFQHDAVKGAVNMPLSMFGSYLQDIANMDGEKVFYCRSGNRSHQAVNYLKSIGMHDVYNGGSVVFMHSYLVP